MFLDIGVLERTAQSQPVPNNNDIWSVNVESWVSPEYASNRLHPKHVFAPAGDSSFLVKSEHSSISEPREVKLNRWRHQLCVPKISTFSLASAAMMSDLSLTAIRKKMIEDPNLIVVIQPFEFGHEIARNLTLLGRCSADLSFVEHVLLKSLPVAGFTSGSGCAGAAQWLEHVVLEEMMTRSSSSSSNKVVRVCAVTSGDASGSWSRSPSAEELNAAGGFAFRSKSHKCVVNPYDDEARGTEAQLVKTLGDVTGLGGVLDFRDDMSTFTAAMANKSLEQRLWSGVEMPVGATKFLMDKENWKKF